MAGQDTRVTLRLVLLLLGALLFDAATKVVAQTEVKVGLIAPMSGPWARQGDLMLKGTNLAIDVSIVAAASKRSRAQS